MDKYIRSWRLASFLGPGNIILAKYLPHWVDYGELVIGWALVFLAIRWLSVPLSPLFSNTYRQLQRDPSASYRRTEWHIHVMSMVHACMILPLAFKDAKQWGIISFKMPRDLNVYAWSSSSASLVSICAGYFIADVVIEVEKQIQRRELKPDFFLLHGVLALAVNLVGGFRPFLQPLGASFLLWEASTPLLNIRWFMLQNKHAQDSRALTVVSLLFMLSFFLARIVWGTYVSFIFYRTMWESRTRMTPALPTLYIASNICLTCLNLYWFMAMVHRAQQSLNKKGPASIKPKFVQEAVSKIGDSVKEDGNIELRRRKSKQPVKIKKT